MKKRILALVLCLSLGLGLTACGSKDRQNEVNPSPSINPGQTTADTSPSPGATPDTTPGAQSTPEDTEEPSAIRFAVLSGPTGVGAAKLLSDNEKGESVNTYDVTVAADNQEIAGKLTSGDLDIACMASNMAANLYNKTNGAIQALCLSTLGVLHILESGEEGFASTVKSINQLRGKTIYATGEGSNPQYVLEYLLRENGLDPAADVEVIWQTAEEVQANLLSGKARFAMLPVPAATAVQVKAKQTENRDVVSVLDLTEEWNKVTTSGVLTMTTVVVRTQFAKENPRLVEDFLTEYAASIDYMNNNVEQAAELVVQFGIVPAAPIAKLAIPDCNLVCITGAQMRDQIQGYYQVLYKANPASIGGGIPDDAFYYGT